MQSYYSRLRVSAPKAKKWPQGSTEGKFPLRLRKLVSQGGG